MILKHKFAVAIGFAALLVCATTSASDEKSHTGKYLLLQYAALNSGEEEMENPLPTYLLVRGLQILPFWAMEARLGAGADDESDVDLQIYYGLFARFGSGSKRRVSPYLLAGYGWARAPSEEDADFQGPAYGVGINVNASSVLGFNLEYVNYYEHEGTNFSPIAGPAIGLTFRF